MQKILYPKRSSCLTKSVCCSTFLIETAHHCWTLPKSWNMALTTKFYGSCWDCVAHQSHANCLTPFWKLTQTLPTSNAYTYKHTAAPLTGSLHMTSLVRSNCLTGKRQHNFFSLLCINIHTACCCVFHRLLSQTSVYVFFFFLASLESIRTRALTVLRHIPIFCFEITGELLLSDLFLIVKCKLADKQGTAGFSQVCYDEDIFRLLCF